MEISCPQCSYSRTVDEDNISTSITLATCPACGHRFRFRESLKDDAAFVLSNENAQSGSPIETGVGCDVTAEGRSGADEVPSSCTDQPSGSAPSQRSADQGRVAPDEGPLPAWAQKQVVTTEVWADMRKKGVVHAFIETSRQIFLTPQAFFSSMSKDVSFLVPFSYYMLSSMLGILLETIWQTAVGNPVLPEAFSGAIGSVEELLQLVLLSPVVMTFYLYLLSGILHLVLMLTGVAKSGTSTTLRVVCYSSAADLLSIIPVVGTLVGGLWRLWLIIVGLRTVYGTTTARILPAVGVLFLALLVVVGIVLRDLGVM